MRINNGVLKKLSQDMNLSLSYLSDVAATRKRPGRIMSKRLEKYSGIEATVWLFGSADQIKAALNDKFCDDDTSQLM